MPGSLLYRLTFGCAIVLSGSVLFAIAQEVPGPASTPAQPAQVSNGGPPEGLPPDETTDPAADAADSENTGVDADADYRRRKLDAMQIDKPLLTAADHEDFRKIRANFSTWLKRGDFVGKRDREKVIREGLHYIVFRLADKELRQSIQRERQALLKRFLFSAGQLQTNANNKKKAREFVLDEVTSLLSQLLDNNLIVRQNAVIVLGQLELMPENNARGEPMIPYAKAYSTLLSVVKDEQQFYEVKIPALSGLKRILQLSKPDGRTQMEIATVLADELSDPATHWWYQRKLCDTLSAIETPRELVGMGRPIVVMALINSLDDEKRHWRVRSTAAYAIGRAGVDGSIRLDPIAWKVVEFCKLMTDAYNAAPNRAYWKECYVNIYLAFHELNPDELKQRAGLKNKEASVSEDYKQVLPVVRAVLESNGAKPVEPALVKNLTDWLNQNVPPNMQYDSSVPPLTRSVAKKVATSTGQKP